MIERGVATQEPFIGKRTIIMGGMGTLLRADDTINTAILSYYTKETAIIVK